MNKTRALVNEWGDFEEKHPDGKIEDFCRHYLAKQQQQLIKGPVAGGVIPPLSAGLLLKLIGRINKLNMSYANTALAGTPLNQVEEYGILLTIQQDKNPRKTDIIHANLFELSSGIDLLNRMKKRGLIQEYADKNDKRSKRIELTPAGTQAIETGRQRIGKVAMMMTDMMTEDDKQLCIQLLKNMEIKYSSLWQSHRGKGFDEVHEEVIGDKKDKQ